MKPYLNPITAPILLAALLCSGAAHADAEDTLNFLVAASYYRDNNLYHLSDGVDPHSVGLHAGRSDTIRSGQLGLRMDKTWSLQRVQLDATTSNNHYSDYSNLSYNANVYRAAWFWQLTPRLTGSLTADRDQSLVNYADYRNFTARNLRTAENRHFDADWWLHGSWHLIGGATQNQVRNDLNVTRQDDYRLRFGEAGAKYVAESGSWISLLARRGNGDYPNITPNLATLSDNQFHQKELVLRANWQISALSTLDARIAHISRQHANFAQRDYSGTVGRIDYMWKPSSQLQVAVAAARDIGSYQDNQLLYTSSYCVTDSFTVAPTWFISSKLSARMNYDLRRRNFKGEITPSTLQRRDTPRTLLLGLDWAPTRTLTLSATAQRDRRGSTIPGFDYEDTSTGVNAQLLF